MSVDVVPPIIVVEVVDVEVVEVVWRVVEVDVDVEVVVDELGTLQYPDELSYVVPSLHITVH